MTDRYKSVPQTKKTIGSIIMIRNVPIWYNFKKCTDLLNFRSHIQTETMKFETVPSRHLSTGTYI